MIAVLFSCHCMGLLNQIMVVAGSDSITVIPILLREAKITVLPEPSIGNMARCSLEQT